MAGNLSFASSGEEMHIIQVREYFDLVKFSHTLFALPFVPFGSGAGGA